MGFAAFAGGVSVSHAYAHIVEVGVEVELAGLHVDPGDVLHGDEHGLLAVPEDLVELLPAVAEAIVAEERAVLAWADSADFSAAGILGRLAAVSAGAVAEARAGEQARRPS
jgi:regulator of RNase E activity RraA